jgi:hypothetical protein
MLTMQGGRVAANEGVHAKTRSLASAVLKEGVAEPGEQRRKLVSARATGWRATLTFKKIFSF